MIDIWHEVGLLAPSRRLNGTLVRVVESQEQVATTHLVDNSLQAQQLLEEMLESNKPPVPPYISTDLNNLLYTPFRYPPLPYGSRFGRKHEPGIFYGSHSDQTAYAEAACYRFKFWHDMVEKPVKHLLSHHSIFSARYSSSKAIELNKDPFSDYSDLLTHPTDYNTTQKLGTSMREQGIEAFHFLSARHKNGINVALLSAKTLKSAQPETIHSSLIETNGEYVRVNDSNGKRYQFEFAALC